MRSSKPSSGDRPLSGPLLPGWKYNRCSMLAALTGIAAVAAGATFAGLHTMVPWSQLYGANFSGAPPGARTLALTYDDGPNDPYTGRLLEVLDRHHVKATFFLLGQFVSERPELAPSRRRGRPRHWQSRLSPIGT